MITVQELKVMNISADTKRMDKLELEIDKELLDTPFDCPDKVEIFIPGEYGRDTRCKIAEKYKKEGHYSKVEHSNSSEAGERPGLTRFVFYY